MEILTWVLHGSLVHQDSEDNSEVIYPDLAHRLSAGIGPVSYTHLDVYKRQQRQWRRPVQRSHCG